MKKSLLTQVLLIIVLNMNAQTTVSASESDAKIIVDGQNLGTGTLKIKVPKNSCVNVKIQKPGFLKYEQTFCNKKGMTEPPKKTIF